MRYVSCTFLLLLASIAVSAPPTLTGPTKVYAESGEWVDIKVDTTGKWVKFRPLDSGLRVFPSDKLKDFTTTLVNAKPGTYKLLVYTGNDDGGNEIEIIVTVAGSQDDKKQDEKKQDEPIGTIPDFWIVLVEETSKRSARTVEQLRDVKFWDSLPGGHAPLMYDKDSPDAKKYKYDLMAEQAGKGLPVVLLVNPKGELIKAEAFTTNVSLRDFIRTTTGK